MRRERKRYIGTLVFLMACCGTFVLQAQQDVPPLLNYQAFITDDQGMGVNGELTITFRIYDQEQNGTKLWASMRKVVVTNGYFDVVLSEGSGSTDAEEPDPKYHSLTEAFKIDDQLSTERYLTFAIEECDEMSPRQLVRSVPYAFTAGDVRRSYSNFDVGESLKVSGDTVIDSKGADSVLMTDLLINGVSSVDAGSNIDKELNIDGRLADKGSLLVMNGVNTEFGIFGENTPAIIYGSSDEDSADIMFEGSLIVEGQYEASATLVSEELFLTNAPIHIMGSEPITSREINNKSVSTESSGTFNSDGFMVNQFKNRNDDCDVDIYFNVLAKGDDDHTRNVSMKSDMSKHTQFVITIPVCKGAGWSIINKSTKSEYELHMKFLPVGGEQ